MPDAREGRRDAVRPRLDRRLALLADRRLRREGRKAVFRREPGDSPTLLIDRDDELTTRRERSEVDDQLGSPGRATPRCASAQLLVPIEQDHATKSVLGDRSGDRVAWCDGHAAKARPRAAGRCAGAAVTVLRSGPPSLSGRGSAARWLATPSGSRAGPGLRGAGVVHAPRTNPPAPSAAARSNARRVSGRCTLTQAIVPRGRHRQQRGPGQARPR